MPFKEIASGSALLLICAAISWAIAYGWSAYQERRRQKEWTAREARRETEIAAFRAAASSYYRALRYRRRLDARAGTITWCEPSAARDPPVAPQRFELPRRRFRELAKDALLGTAAGTWHVLFVAIMLLLWWNSDHFLYPAIFAICLFLATMVVAAVCDLRHAWRASEKPVGEKLANGIVYAFALIGLCATLDWLDKHAPWWWLLAAIGLTFVVVVVALCYETWSRRRLAHRQA
jgi:hypothetical protein